jgi:membrane protease YdiL (CAAX protease family)
MSSRPTGPGPAGRWPRIGLPLTLVAILAVWGVTIVRRVEAAPPDAVLALGCFVLLLLPALLFSAEDFTARLRSNDGLGMRLLFPAWLGLAWVVFVAGPGRFRASSALLFALYLYLPVGVAAIGAARPVPALRDAALVLTLYLPVELAWVAPAWEPGRNDLPSPAHAFTQLTGVNLALFCFLVVRRLDGVGYRFRLRPREAGLALAAFVAFFPVAVILGDVTGFVPFEPHWPEPGKIAGVVLGVTFLVALPEELLFRGIVQNLLERISPTSTGRGLALAGTAVLFGLSHLNNHPRLDWRYVSIATLAGLVYGWVYRATGRITAAAIPHALVDIVWRLGFS